MNLEFFIVGGVIFSVYMYFTLWNIYYSSKKQRENNYPNYNQPDTMDMDGMANYGRFPKIDTTNPKNKVKRDSKKK